MENSPPVHPLFKVAQGLHLLNWVFWLPYVLALPILILICSGLITPLSGITAVFVAMTIGGPILNIRGRTLCYLYAPVTGSARIIVSVTAITDVVTLLLSLANMLIALPQLLRVFGFFEAVWLAFQLRSEGSLLLIILQLGNTTLFLFFLRWLAQYIEDRKLVRRTMIVFWVALVLVVALIHLVVLGLLGFFGLALVGILLIALLFGLVMAVYGDLHYHIRKAILKKLWT